VTGRQTAEDDSSDWSKSNTGGKSKAASKSKSVGWGSKMADEKSPAMSLWKEQAVAASSSSTRSKVARAGGGRAIRAFEPKLHLAIATACAEAVLHCVLSAGRSRSKPAAYRPERSGSASGTAGAGSASKMLTVDAPAVLGACIAPFPSAPSWMREIDVPSVSVIL